METRLNYSPSDCFETFPFPDDIAGLEEIGERYYVQRQAIMQARQEGLTKTYNRFHHPQDVLYDIEELRALHVQMDQAVAAAYGWSDLALEHGFHQTRQGLRYTISEAARREVLARLLRLNHERHAAEVAADIADERGRPVKKRPHPVTPSPARRGGTNGGAGGVAESRAEYAMRRIFDEKE